MTSPLKAPLLAGAFMLLAATTLSGCAPEPSEPKPTPTAEQASAPSTPSPTLGPESPTGSPEQPESPPAFAESELVQICIDATTSAYDSDVVFDPAGARIEKRTVSPEWLVLVPAQTNGYDGESVCTIGGSPADPDIEMSSGSIHPLPEEQIQRLIRGENEGGE